jgi:MoxR-like ATPase
MPTRDAILDLKKKMGESIIGQEAMIERLLLGLLANGNLLVEGLPGLAKTRAIKSLAKHLEADFSRLQFTPDLLPADITGSEVYYTEGGKGQFKFQQGPVFANLVLADEVNRAPAKVQAALLEAMEERQVTVAGQTHKLPDLFLVMATQNPIEQEGTYPLPEAQMDRFLMHVQVGYPDEKSEGSIVELVRGEEKAAADHAGGTNSSPKGDPAAPPASAPAAAPAPAPAGDRVEQKVVFDARREIAAITVSDAVKQYIVALIFATRQPDKVDEKLGKWLQVGASPRGAIGLDKTSRACAWLAGRNYVTPDDVRNVVHDVLRHRLMLSYDAHADGITADKAIDLIVEKVAVS